MKPIRAAAVCSVLVLLCARPVFCAPSAFAFLEVPAGARAAALGGAFASLAQGVEAAFWNPAGLEGVKGVQITGTHAEYLQTLRLEQFAVAGRSFGGGLAVSLRALYSEPIPETDVDGNPTLDGSFGYQDLEFALAYGHSVAPGLSVGGTVQAVRERMADVSANTYAAGFGAVWVPARVNGLRLGLSAHNLGKAARYGLEGGPGEPMPLPAAVQGGGSWQRGFAHGAVLRTALEGRFTQGRNGIGMVGVELATVGGANGAASLRGGLRMNDDASSYSLGAGYALAGLRVDYAFVPMRFDLGDTHRAAFTAQF
jgi:hypothetical protein